MPRRGEYERPSGPHEVYLDGGARSAGWLVERTDASTSQRTLEWDAALHREHARDADHSTRLHAAGPPLDISPADRCNYPETANQAVSAGQIYSSAQHLHHRHPDAHIPHSLLVEAFLQDEKLLDRPDDEKLNSIGIAQACLGRTEASHRFCVAAFARGRRSDEICLVRSQSRKGKETRGNGIFEVVAQHRIPLKFFGPVRLIQVATRVDGCTIGVKTASGIGIIDLADPRKNPPARSKFFRQEHVRLFPRHEFDGLMPIHFCLSPFDNSKIKSPQALVVDELGGLWATDSVRSMRKIAAGQTPHSYSALYRLRSGSSSFGRTAFARVSYGCSERQAIIALEDAIRVFDLDSPSKDYTLFQLTDGRSRILDMGIQPAEIRDKGVRAVLTNREILWFDIAMPGKILERYRHRRDRDPTLALETAFLDGICYTILWSRRTSTLTMIAHTATTPLQLIGEPSDVTTDTNGRKRRGLSLQMIEHKHNAKKDKHQGSQLGSPRVLVLLSHFEDGSVCRHFLTGMRWKQLVSSICVETQNSTSHEVPNFPPEHSAIDEKHRKVKDASKSYTKIFGTHGSLKDAVDAEITSQDWHLDKADGAPEFMLTSLESMMEQDDEQLEDLKAVSFTSGEAVESTDVLLSGLEDRLRAHRESDLVNFSFPIRTNVPTSGTNPVDFNQELALRYGLNAPAMSERPDGLRAAHRFACQQVTADLSLSSQVFSSHRPTQPDHLAVDVSMFVQRDSSSIPQVEMGYFGRSGQPFKVPLKQGAAVRALLSEWTLGADPTVRPTYINPYNDTKREQETAAEQQLQAFKSRVASGIDISASQPLPSLQHQKPPAPIPTASSKRKSVIAEKSNEERQSQHGLSSTPGGLGLGPGSSQGSLPSSSQTPLPPLRTMPATQVVGGPHGGRPIKKKRVGGF